MIQIERTIYKQIDAQLFKGKVIVVYGARRVGKTFLMKQILQNYPKGKYINCELLQNQIPLETTNTELLINFFGETTPLVILDEAQHIQNIGMILKVLVDTFPNIQFIATGSSSFELGNKISEPLTGRSRVFQLFPLSFEEIISNTGIVNAKAQLETILRYGSYPEVHFMTEKDSTQELNNISSNYLYRDILQFENIRKPELVKNLLIALALQIGNELSYNELANMLGQNVHIIKKYLDLLEKSFVIFRLTPFSRNLRNEIGKGQKIYFYDLGIRNALIRNFNPLILRQDVGQLWENFVILERYKLINNNIRFVNTYYWRTYAQKEVDLVEEESGVLNAYECKYNPNARFSFPKEFADAYPQSNYEVIHNENFWKFLITK